MRPSLAKADLVIFDCDGVLVDSEVLSCECLSEVLGQYGIVVSQDEALERFLGRSAVAVLHYYRNEPRLIPETFLAELKALVARRFRRAMFGAAFVAQAEPAGHTLHPEATALPKPR